MAWLIVGLILGCIISAGVNAVTWSTVLLVLFLGPIALLGGLAFAVLAPLLVGFTGCYIAVLISDYQTKRKQKNENN